MGRRSASGVNGDTRGLQRWMTHGGDEGHAALTCLINPFKGYLCRR